MYNDFSAEQKKQEFPVAMAYVPWQQFQGIFDNLEKAFCIGTIFPCLDQPFTGRRCLR